MNHITKVMIISVITNTFLSVIKMIFGSIGNSSALVADGIHSLSDLITDFCAIIGSRLARRPADKEHPYGHGKLEYITSIVIGSMILILGLNIIYHAFDKNQMIPSMIVVCVSFVTIICKYFLSTYIVKKGKKYQNSILIASGIESKTDCISSIVVLISALLMQISQQITILKYADLIATIVVGIFIVKVGFKTLQENINMILGELEENQDYLAMLATTILENEEIIHIDELHLIKYGYYYRLQITISMDSNITLKKAHNIVDFLESEIKNQFPKIKYINVHMEPDE